MPCIDDRTHDQLERSVSEIDFDAVVEGAVAKRRAANPAAPYWPSPASWADEILYFLMVDRFSDGKERADMVNPADPNSQAFRDNNGQTVAGGTTPLFRFSTDAYTADRKSWLKSGDAWCGGTLKGLLAKLGYLKRLGVSAIWVSPLFKQVDKTYDPISKQLVSANSYHGYGTQNFLDIDPHFGTRQDLKDFVEEAHRLGLRVILDIVVNHVGDVFQYEENRSRYPMEDTDGNWVRDVDGNSVMDPRWDNGSYPVFKTLFGKPEVGAFS